MIITLGSIERRLNDIADGCETDIKKFVESFANNNAAYVLSWSANTFVRAAELSFAKQLLGLITGLRDTGLTSDEILEKLKEFTLDTITSKARNDANKSTSVTSNYMDDCVAAAAAKFLERLI